MLAAGCSSGDDPTAVAAAAGADRGVELEVDAAYFAGSRFLVVDTVVTNGGPDPIELVPSQCGRLAVARLARTVLPPEGRPQSGTIAAAKEWVLRSQRRQHGPSGLAPRDGRLPLPEGGDCVRRDPPVTLAPGDEVVEVYSLALQRDTIVDVVGSANLAVQVDVLFAADGQPPFSDWYSPDQTVEVFAGNLLRARIPLGDLVTVPATGGDTASDGEVFDRLIEHAELRAWMLERAEDGWRQVELNRHASPDPELAVVGDHTRLRMITAEFEEALVATFDADLELVDLQLPTTPTVPYPRAAAAPPPAASVMPVPGDGDPWELVAELALGELTLPTGRVVLSDGTFLTADDAVVRHALPPGSYPVTATVARARRDTDGSNERVAFVTVHGPTTPVRWEPALTFAVDPGDVGPDEVYGFGVDGGTAGIASAEAVELLLETFDGDEPAYWAAVDAAFDRLTAYDHVGALQSLGDELEFFVVSTGFGDGFKPTWVGFDEAGEPAQFVAEFGVLYLEFAR